MVGTECSMLLERRYANGTSYVVLQLLLLMISILGPVVCLFRKMSNWNPAKIALIMYQSIYSDRSSLGNPSRSGGWFCASFQFGWLDSWAIGFHWFCMNFLCRAFCCLERIKLCHHQGHCNHQLLYGLLGGRAPHQEKGGLLSCLWAGGIRSSLTNNSSSPYSVPISSSQLYT